MALSSCGTVKSTSDITKVNTDTSVSKNVSHQEVSTFDSTTWINNHGTYKIVEIPVWIHDTITKKDTVLYSKTTEGVYNKDKSTSIKKASYDSWYIWNHYNVYTNYEVVKTTEKKTSFSWWPYIITLIGGVALGFWLSKLLSPEKILTTIEDEYNKLKASKL